MCSQRSWASRAYFGDGPLGYVVVLGEFEFLPRVAWVLGKSWWLYMCWGSSVSMILLRSI